MKNDGCQNRIFAEPALQKFLDARATGTASPAEMERLKRAAFAEKNELVALSNRARDNGMRLGEFLEFLSANGLAPAELEQLKRIGTCGRRKDDQCGLLDPSECEIHGK